MADIELNIEPEPGFIHKKKSADWLLIFKVLYQNED
jgi:hypothetical protein